MGFDRVMSGRKFESRRGFTIVELLVVVIVIGLLATVSIVAYNGIQARSRDAARASDISRMKSALFAYNAIHGGVMSY